MTATGINANTKAFAILETSPAPGITDIPSMTDIVTPNRAPDDIPVVYGSANGFLIEDCITAPDIPSVAPASIPTIALGTFPSNTR